MTRASAVLSIAMIVPACTVTDHSPAIVGTWEMDTTRTRHLAAEQRASEMFTCSERGDRVRCAIVSERYDGSIYNTQFEAEIGGPRSLVQGFADVQEVQISDDASPVLDLTFYDRNKAAYTWRARRSGNGDTLFVDRVDVTPDGPRSASTIYRRVRRGDR